MLPTMKVTVKQKKKQANKQKKNPGKIDILSDIIFVTSFWQEYKI